MLTHSELHVLTLVERGASILSGLGVVTIIGVFISSRHFRNPINRLIFINAFFNIFDVTATMISLSGPDAGNRSHLCQFQGFLMQMFPLTDVFWTLAMAIDVYLIVFHKYDAEDLRRLEIKYIVGIAAFCGIPAVVFLFIRTPAKGPMYASVTLWCSIARNWVLFRIVFFYAIIWLVIFIILLLYSLVGLEVLKQRRLLRSFDDSYIHLGTAASGRSVTSSHPKNGIAVTAYMPDLNDPSDIESAVSSSKNDWPLTQTQNTVVIPPPNRGPVSFGQYILMPLMFFVVLLAVWVAPTANRLGAFINPHFESYPLLLAVGSMGSLRGFWNGVVFLVVGARARNRQKT